MKKLFIPLLVAGIIPFVYPFIGYVYRVMIAESWTLGSWLVLYSFVYWYTYVIGLVLIAAAVFIRIYFKNKNK